MQRTRRQLLTTATSAAVAACCPPLAVFGQTTTATKPIADAQITVTVDDATVAIGDRSARVQVTLSVPATHTIVIAYGAHAAFGSGRTESRPHPEIIRGEIIFQPGEQRKVIEVPLEHQLLSGQSVELHVADFGYPRRTYANKTSRIAQGPSRSPLPFDDSVELPHLPAGGSVVFADDLLDPDFANDNGLRADGTACWQSRPSHGRRQDGNKELGYYADPALNAEATVWGIDPQTRHRFIEAEYLDNGLSDGNGGKLSPGWQVDRPFRYSAAMVTSRTLFNRITIGSYVEFNVKLTNVQGSWPALWLKPANGMWPPEIDLLEAFISSRDYRPDVITSSIHWRDGLGHQSYGAAVPLNHLEQGADVFERFNRFGCFIGDKQITYYFNRKPYCGMPNLVGAGPWYMLMNVAVGGLVREPSDPKAFPAPMHIAGVKVVQYS